MIPAALALALGAGLHPAATRTFRAQADEQFEIRYLPSPAPLRYVSEPIRLSIANFYWLQAVQYVGDARSRQAGLPQLYPLVGLVTDLDPGHGYAYQTAGIVLSGMQRLEESDAILKKGMTAGPNWWSYPFYLAFNDYYYRGDYASAARWADRAARTPGASPNISKLAMALSVKGGDPEHAIRMLEELLASAQEEQVRSALEEQRREAILQRDFALLDAALARFKETRGREPRRLEDLVAAGVLGAIPPEPYGGAYLLRDGAVHSTGRDYRIPPPAPGRLQRPSPTPERP